EAIFHIQQVAEHWGFSLSRQERDCFTASIFALCEVWHTPGAELSEELQAFCRNVLKLLVGLLAQTQLREDAAAYCHLQGVLYACLAAGSREQIQLAKEAFETARAHSEELSALNPVRVSLMTDLALFTMHVLDNKEEAFQLGRIAFEDGIGFNMGRGEEWEREGYDEATVNKCLKRLRYLLEEWSSDEA
ncbi:unnamed protein product, partial [Effrenium voratum]